MAGIDTGLNLNAGYQRQWTSVPGSPTLQNLTADYNSGKRVGLGFIIYNDGAGLIDQTRIMGTYAYHLPLNDRNDKLNFGISLGINNSYLDYNSIVADPGDLAAQNFSQHNLYIDGDIGVSYTSNGLNIQAAVPNLKNVFFANNTETLDAGRATFYTALSYKIPLNNSEDAVVIEPKVAYRGARGLDNIFDAGFNIDLKEYHINLSGMYHTDQSATVAFGLNTNTIGFLFAYTYNTGQLSTYANNTFEFGLSYKLFK